MEGDERLLTQTIEAGKRAVSIPEQNLKMGGIFTVMSLARSFALRRMFERLNANAR